MEHVEIAILRVDPMYPRNPMTPVLSRNRSAWLMRSSGFYAWKIMGFKTRLAILGSFTVGLVIFMAAGVQVFESFQAPKKAATTEGTISIRTKRVPWFALMR